MTIYEVAINFHQKLKPFKFSRYKKIPYYLFRGLITRIRNAIVRHNTITVCEEERLSPCLVSMGRDWKHLTKAFLGHYKDLGFTSFIFLDNNSKDESVSHVIKEGNKLGCSISIYRCNLDYKRYKYAMKNFLIASAPTESWILCADSDEFLVLPKGVKDIKQIIEYLEKYNYDTVQFHLLDMFCDQPLRDLPNEVKWTSANLENFYRYFDISTLKSTRVNGRIYSQHQGGVRMKHFGVNPLLTKSLFFKKTGVTNLISSHHLLTTVGSKKRKLADFSLFVKHYKFNSHYTTGLAIAIQENSYYDNNSECRPIFERLKEAPLYTFNRETTKVYQDCEQLRACGFITFSKTFQSYLDNTCNI